MTVARKIAVSLLLSLLLFAAFAVMAFTNLFDEVESRFFNPAITAKTRVAVAEDALVFDSFINTLSDQFTQTLSEAAVRRSFLVNQSTEDILKRAEYFGRLMESLPGLQSVRFIDQGGKWLHFSTLKSDILRQDELSLAYRNFDELEPGLDFASLALSPYSAVQLLVDPVAERLLFIYPFVDSYDTYKGLAIFTVSARTLVESFVASGHLNYGEDLGLVADPPGLVAGLPRVGRDRLSAVIAETWREGFYGPSLLSAEAETPAYILISAKTREGLFIARLYGESIFSFPSAMKIILLASFLMTIFLVIFLLFNLRQDPMVVLRDRLKHFQISLLEEYYEKKDELDWPRWSRELSRRREEVKGELKHKLGGRLGRKTEVQADELIEKTWEDILSSISGRSIAGLSSRLEEKQLQELLVRLLRVNSQTPDSAPESKPPQLTARADEPIELVELEEVAELNELDELAELEEPAELDEPANLNELAELEELEEVAELDEPAELDELAELEEVAELNELDELAELEEPAELDEPADLNELAELEELEEVAELDEPAELEELAEASETSEQSGISPLLKLAGLSEAPPLEDLDALVMTDETIGSTEFPEETEAFETEPVDIEFFDEVESDESAEVSSDELAARLAARLKEIEREVEFSLEASDEGQESPADDFSDFQILSPFNKEYLADDNTIVQKVAPETKPIEMKDLIDSVTAKPTEHPKSDKEST